jgi:hypothetical protein
MVRDPTPRRHRFADWRSTTVQAQHGPIDRRASVIDGRSTIADRSAPSRATPAAHCAGSARLGTPVVMSP